MANDIEITIVGNLTADPELRFTPSGAAVANFTVGSTPRSFDKTTQQWKDGETIFMNCTAWRDLAENMAGSLTKGTKVIAVGTMSSHSWEKDGQKFTRLELDVSEVGPALSFATAKVTRIQKNAGYAPAAPATASAAMMAAMAAPLNDSEPPF